MKLNLNKDQIKKRLAYHNYSQDCLNSDPIEIPEPYKNWEGKVDKDEINNFLKRDFSES